MYGKLGFDTFAKTGDIYCLFYEKGVKLLKSNGILTFITSNTWMRAGYGKKLRFYLAENTNPIVLIDFAGQKIFESATVDVNILSLKKQKNKGITKACTAGEECRNNLSVYFQQHSVNVGFKNNENWVILSDIEQSIQKKIRAIGTPLSEWNININFGIKTGLNDAFIISSEKRNELIAADAKSAEIIRPILRGRDIKRYSYTFPELWLISTFPSQHYNIDDFPAIKEHLLSFGINRLEQTGCKRIIDGHEVKARKKTNNKWYETQDSISYWDDFSKQKIIWKRIGSKLRFSYDETGIYCLDSTCFATGANIPYLVAVLNSTMGNYLLKDSPKTGTGDLLISVQALVPVKIPNLSAEQQIPYEKILNTILECIKRGSDYTQYEKTLESMIFDAYGLTVEERNFVIQTVQNMYR